jgi:hypothetical protein
MKRDAPPTVGDAPPKKRDAPPIKREAPLLSLGGSKSAFDGSCLPEQATFLDNATPHDRNLSALYHFQRRRNADSVASSGCLKLPGEELSALRRFPKAVMSDR